MRRWRDHRMQRLGSRLVYLGRHEWPLLLSLLLVAGVIWTFAVLADAVIAGGTQAFDRAILLPMRAPEDPTRPVGLSWARGRDARLHRLGERGSPDAHAHDGDRLSAAPRENPRCGSGGDCGSGRDAPEYGPEARLCSPASNPNDSSKCIFSRSL